MLARLNLLDSPKVLWAVSAPRIEVDFKKKDVFQQIDAKEEKNQINVSRTTLSFTCGEGEEFQNLCVTADEEEVVHVRKNVHDPRAVVLNCRNEINR